MSAEETPSKTRPVLRGQVTSRRTISSPRGGGGRVLFANQEAVARRLDARFDEAAKAIVDQLQIAESINAADPQLVLVFEALDEHIDLAAVASRLKIELLTEVEGTVSPTDDFRLKSRNPLNPYVGSCLHAICANQTALSKLLTLWRQWRAGKTLPYGHSSLRELFSHLKDVRPWGPQDRLQAVDWDEYFAGQIDDRPQYIEIELWYRRSPEQRHRSEQEVTALVEQAGGRVVTRATIDQIGYHGLKCLVPNAVLRNLASGNHEAVRLVRSANVMYLRVSGQTLPAAGPQQPLEAAAKAPMPTGDPVLCLLDGAPTANHPLLDGRVEVHDPDDLLGRGAIEDLRHGTWMASVAVWGDRGAGEPPARRPVLIRPILTPAADTQNQVEELPAHELPPDLMWRVFRELFEGASEQQGVGSSITIIGISVGDPAAPFDTIMSSWARMLDWLSYKYGVLVIVSAGNHSRLVLDPTTSDDVIAAHGNDRRLAVLEAMARQQGLRRLLAPAESVNAVSVGATHQDASSATPQGYAVDPSDGLPSISPVSPTGSGYRRSVKPDLVASGGRVFFQDTIAPQSSLAFRSITSLGPGIRVAAPGTTHETHIAGTSPAAAWVARRAAGLHDVVSDLSAGSQISKRQRACAVKALLAHGTVTPDPAEHMPLPGESTFGYGTLVRDFADGCATNEAVVLYVGEIGANEEQELLFPLPDGLSARGTKRIESTLAWLTPVNWRHRQYRRASLTLLKPDGALPTLGASQGLSSATSARGATTLQRQTWELRSAFASGRGSAMRVRVKCHEQAGGLLGERVDFAVALSLWVAPELGVNVYEQVRAQVQTRVPIQPKV